MATASATDAATSPQADSSTPATSATPSATRAPTAAVPTPTSSATPSRSAAPTTAFGSAPTGLTQKARVVRVVDGDTIRVVLAGEEYAVRYIGIDTPETVHFSQPVEWMGREASAANAELVEGRIVELERDISETDRYGRLLRYVWLANEAGWLLVNQELVRRGFALVSTYPPDVRYSDLFLASQRLAREGALGLWGGQPKPTETSRPDIVACDPSYPGVCIPPSPPDLDCGDIPYRRFDVLPPDPHRFDGDYDGYGCESG